MLVYILIKKQTDKKKKPQTNKQKKPPTHTTKNNPQFVIHFDLVNGFYGLFSCVPLSLALFKMYL